LLASGCTDSKSPAFVLALPPLYFRFGRCHIASIHVNAVCHSLFLSLYFPFEQIQHGLGAGVEDLSVHRTDSLPAGN
jgi:hypothetical protein